MNPSAFLRFHSQQLFIPLANNFALSLSLVSIFYRLNWPEVYSLINLNKIRRLYDAGLPLSVEFAGMNLFSIY